jgi:hypothetical protein
MSAALATRSLNLCEWSELKRTSTCDSTRRGVHGRSRHASAFAAAGIAREMCYFDLSASIAEES